MSKLFSALPSFVSLAVYRATAGQSSDRMAVLTIHGNELPQMFRGVNADDAKQKAADHFFANYSTSTALTVVEPDYTGYIMPLADYQTHLMETKMDNVIRKTKTGETDGRSAPRVWMMKEGHKIRVLESDIDARLSEGYVMGKKFGYVPPVKKAEGEAHGNAGKVWMHKFIEGKVERIRVTAADVTPQFMAGFLIGRGPDSVKA